MQNDKQNQPEQTAAPTNVNADAASKLSTAEQSASAHNALLETIAVANKGLNETPAHLKKKPYTLYDFFEEIFDDHQAENKRYVMRYLEHSFNNHLTYCPYSTPVRDHRNHSLWMWYALGKYVDTKGRPPELVETLFAEARKAGVIALENKFTTIIS